MDFAAHLETYLNELSEIRRRGASEAALRDAFLRMLRAAFPALGEAAPLLIEERIPALRVQGGVADALYGYLIFEFKRQLDTDTRTEGIEQLTRYLLNQHDPEQYFGILTDGETLEVYALRNARATKIDTLVLKGENADAAALWLDCYLFQSRRLRPTSVDVARRFGEFSPTFWQSLRVLRACWEHFRQEPHARTKFVEWQNLLSIVYGSEIGDEELFLRHTYLALFARVLAFATLNRRTLDDSEVDAVLSGVAFERAGLTNFVGDDFFTWADSSAVRPLMRALAMRLTAAYELSAIHEDLLKGLYQELVDPQTRHELGEYYTPDWLAELTLRKAGFPPMNPEQISLIDPACGSGTFLFTAVRLLKQVGYKGIQLMELCRNLAGIDVHPLAVIIAKTNLVLAVGDDLRAGEEGFEIPIYMADTLSLPEKSLPIIEVPVNIEAIAKMKGEQPPVNLPKAFAIPTEIGDFQRQFDAIIDRLLLIARPTISEDDASRALEQSLRDLGIPSEQDHFWRSNLRLMRWLMKSPEADTVWRFVLKNACRPALLAHRKFQYVVGNPPWLAYRYIRRRDYQERVRKMAYSYQLLSRKDTHLLTHTELATLFFAFCANHYLVEGGTLAFVMPRSVLTGAKQHALFRQYYVATATLVIDCEQVSPLFSVPTCSIIWEKMTRKARKRVPCLQASGNLPTKNESLEQITRSSGPVLRLEPTYYTLPALANGSPYLGSVTQGATIVPRCLWFVSTPQDALTVDRKTPHVETDARVEPRAKQPWRGIRLSHRVESDFLFATLLSDNLLPFGWRELSTVLLPVQSRSDGQLILYESWQQVMTSGKVYASQWFEEAERLWKQRCKPSQPPLMAYLNWQGKLTRQRAQGVYKLLYNASGTYLCACVIDADAIARQTLGQLRVQGFVADSTTYWFETTNHDEAHYLCAFLNAPIVDEAIKPFQAKGAFGALSGKGQRHICRLPFEVVRIPVFEPENQLHQQLAALSRDCHQKMLSFLSDPANRSLLTQTTGTLRQTLRKRPLATELAQIDALVKQILAVDAESVNTSSTSSGKGNGVLDL